MLGILQATAVYLKLPPDGREASLALVTSTVYGTASPQSGTAVCGARVQVGPRSDSMDKFCELFGVPKWLRQATRLMTGMHISVAGDTLVVKQVCGMLQTGSCLLEMSWQCPVCRQCACCP
jgi:hypothetical protein